MNTAEASVLIVQVNSAVLLEEVNGAWAILGLALFVTLAIYFVKEWRRNRLTLKKWLAHGLPPHLSLVVALMTYVAGSASMRGALWYWRHQVNTSVPAPALVNNSVVLAASLTAAVGMLCMMRVISREWVGHWPWISAAVIALTFVVAMGGSPF